MKNDPVASTQTLHPPAGPSKQRLEKARLGLDRFRLWVRGTPDLGLDDSDLIALEDVATWMRECRVLNPTSVRLIANALQAAVGCIELTSLSAEARATVDVLMRAGEVLRGE